MDYRESYERIFRETLAAAPPGTYDDSALPSYTHPNRLMAWLFWRRVCVALTLAAPRQSESVLDFGCGGATTFRRLADCGCRITGCDVATHALAAEVCRRLGVEASLVAGLGEIDPGETFDIILALDVLEHVEDLNGTLGRLTRFLGSRGRLVVSGPTENVLYHIGRRLAGFSGHYHVRDIHAIESALHGLGFRCERLIRLYPAVPLFRISLWTSPTTEVVPRKEG